MNCILIIPFYNEPLLICSTQATGVIHDTFAGKDGEGEGGEKEATGDHSTATSAGQARKSLSTWISIAEHSHAHAY